MKKIYYLQTHPVKIGDVIEHNGIKTVVTKELIELNPELFRVEENTQPIYFKCIKASLGFTLNRIYKQVNHKDYPQRVILQDDNNSERKIINWKSVYINESSNCFELTTKEEWDKQELLDKAKRRYPIGTVYKHFNSKYTINSPDMLTVSEMDHHFSFGTSIWVASEEYNGIVYEDGEWAEILPLKFTTEDGVDIYGDMKTYLVHPNDSGDISSYHVPWDGGSKGKGNKYFYHKENALAYIKKHREKTLEDYESNLFEIMQTNVYSSNNRHYFSVWSWIKDNEPKLYYTKILQLVADHLNDGWVADFSKGGAKWFIKEGGSDWTILHNYGAVYFKSEELSEKARNIMGSKLDYLFN